MPPVTRSVSPVGDFESDEARYTATGEVSPGWPLRPSGDCASIHFRKSPSSLPAACTPSVSIKPGLMEFTRTFRGPNFFASLAVMALTDGLVAEYTVVSGGSMVLMPERI